MSSPPDDERLLRAVALACIPRVGPYRYRVLFDQHGDGAAAFDATIFGAERDAALTTARTELEAAARCGASVSVIGSANYPEQLRELYAPPPVLFSIGDVGMLAPPLVAIVGTRSATSYGARVVAALASRLAAAGACIVSGLARGIDAMAHRAALEAGGRTIAVLGSGIDVCFPPTNRALYRAIASRGLLVSEFWCGRAPAKGSFPRRNRIIAGLARATIVIEAGDKSGALLTADHALEIHRDIGAIPGPIDSPQSRGTNTLLQRGAHVITRVEDALELIGLPVTPRKGAIDAHGSEDEQALWNALIDGARNDDELTTRTGLPTSRILSALSTLELRGRVHVDPHGVIHPAL
jgi:DNA processing protein